MPERFQMIMRSKFLDKLNWYMLDFEEKFGPAMYFNYDSKMAYGECTHGVYYDRQIDYSLNYHTDHGSSKWHPLNSVLISINRNPNAIDFLRTHPNLVLRDEIGFNERAGELWSYLEMLDHEWANGSLIYEIRERLERGEEPCWKHLSANPKACDILEQNLEKIDIWELSENPGATVLLEKYPELRLSISESSDLETDWEYSEDQWTSGYDVDYRDIEEDWSFYDPSIFTYNYEEIKYAMQEVTSMVMAYFYRPEAIGRWIESCDFEDIGSEEYLRMSMIQKKNDRD